MRIWGYGEDCETAQVWVWQYGVETKVELTIKRMNNLHIVLNNLFNR